MNYSLMCRVDFLVGIKTYVTTYCSDLGLLKTFTHENDGFFYQVLRGNKNMLHYHIQQ